MDVLNESGDFIGIVDSLSSNGVQDILHIKGEQELDVLFIDRFVISIDLKERSIVINVPELI
jgi:ribosomal 30S subunit maturation factor RimM